MKNFKVYFIVISLLVFILFLSFIELDSNNPSLTKMAAIAILMTLLWISEAIPLAITSLIPLILFPILGILDGEQIASSYINSTIFLFYGGFTIAIAMEKWNFHKRMALKIISLFGGKPNNIVFGFILASAFISMWISNTATAVMLLPIGLSIILQIEEKFSNHNTHNIVVCLLIGIAYGASIGGIATLIGTPPNLSFARILHIIFPNAPYISFGNWLIAILPISMLILFAAWFLLTKIFYKIDKSITLDKNIIKNELKNLGKLTFEEKVVGIIFFITAILWIFRSNLELGFITLPGWSILFNNPTWINDGTVVIFTSSILYFIPAKNSKSSRILSGEIIQKIPWDIILLFGGGFALAKGFVVSGLSKYIGNIFTFSHLSPIVMMIIVALTVTFLTELTSNTATAEMILPILASISVALNINPMLLMLNATISVSMAFMLPVATPPNAVIFGSKRIKILEMAKIGFFLNLISAAIIILCIYFYSSKILGIDLNQFPIWAK